MAKYGSFSFFRKNQFPCSLVLISIGRSGNLIVHQTNQRGQLSLLFLCEGFDSTSLEYKGRVQKKKTWKVWSFAKENSLSVWSYAKPPCQFTKNIKNFQKIISTYIDGFMLKEIFCFNAWELVLLQECFRPINSLMKYNLVSSSTHTYIVIIIFQYFYTLK